MNGRMAKKLRKEARRMAAREQEKLVPEFKRFVNVQLKFGERLAMSWRILWKRL